MAGRKGKGKGKGSKKGGKKGGKGSRQKDRKQEKVDFEPVFDPIVIEREGSDNFVQVSRTEVIGQKSGDVQTEFLQIKPGFYVEDDDDEHFMRKCDECEKAPGVTFAPSMLGEIVAGLMEMATDDEAEELGWDEEEEEDDDDDDDEDD